MVRKGFFSCLLVLVFILSSCGPAPLATLPSDLAPDKQVVGYFAEWAPGEGYFVSDILASKITHINYAFSNVSENGECQYGDPAADVERLYTAAESVSGIADSIDPKTFHFHGNFNQLLELKAKYPYLKVLISVGGYSWSGNFSNAALTDAVPPKIRQVVHRSVSQDVQGRFRWHRYRLGISGQRRPDQRAPGRQT